MTDQTVAQHVQIQMKENHFPRLSAFLAQPSIGALARIDFQADEAVYDTRLGIGGCHEIQTFCGGYDLSLLHTGGATFAVMPVRHWFQIMGVR